MVGVGEHGDVVIVTAEFIHGLEHEFIQGNRAVARARKAEVGVRDVIGGGGPVAEVRMVGASLRIGADGEVAEDQQAFLVAEFDRFGKEVVFEPRLFGDNAVLEPGVAVTCQKPRVS